MINYVTDANVIFSALISGKSTYIKLANENRIFLPDYALQELQEYQNLILEKTKKTSVELKTYTVDLFNRLTVLPNFVISLRSYLAAFELCKDIDRKDIVYIALAIEFNYIFLTRDKALTDGLRAKGFTNIVLLDQLLSQMDEPDSTNLPE